MQYIQFQGQISSNIPTPDANNLNLFVDESDGILKVKNENNEIIFSGDLKNITYSELRNMISGSTLTTGNLYQIIDFKTCYDQPDYDYNGNPIVTNNYKESTIDPIIVFATSGNTISTIAYQPSYPNDKIQYDWTFNSTEVTNGVAYGRITERIDEFNNRTDYDHRTIKFKRYRYIEVDLSDPYIGTVVVTPTSSTQMLVTGTGTNFLTLINGFYVGFENTDLKVYEITNIVSDTQMYVSGLTVTNVYDVKMYPSYARNYVSYYQNNITTTDFIVDYTFDYNYDVINNYIGDFSNINQYSEIAFMLSNNVFKGGISFNNKFGDSCFNNTFGVGLCNNTINNNFFDNIIDNFWNDNTIDNFFHRNKITSYFSENIIGNNFFDNNFIGYSFYQNQITLSFYGNKISGDFFNNKIDFNFSGNFINNLFCRNKISESFFDNKIYSNFNENLIGNRYAYNKVYSEFFNNQIGNSFEENIIGDIGNKSSIDFHRNKIGNDFNGNIIRQEFQNNQIGNQFNGNIVNGTFYKNFIGNGFNNNDNIGHDFYGNHIGNGFNNNNVIGDYFHNNKIGEYFNNNNISYNFNDNQINNTFESNTLGNTQYFNWDNTSIQNLTGRTYDTFYNSLNEEIGNVILGKELIMHDTVNDEYHKVKFTQWTQNNNGGGFSYERTKVYPTVEPTIYFTKLNNSDIVDTIVEGSLVIKRNSNGGIYNVAEEGNFNSNVSPYGTRWNSIYTQNNNGSGFDYNKITNDFKGNYILNNFSLNNVESYVLANQFSGSTISNKIGPFTIINNFLGSLSGNSWLGDFYNNTLGDNFTGNDFYSEIHDNHIGDNFFGNEIKNLFIGNTIENNFGYGNSTPQSNKIGNNFMNNQIGEYFYNNVIPDNFTSNNIGKYFQWNIFNTNINNTDFTINYGNITGFSYVTTGNTAGNPSTIGVIGTTNGDGILAEFTLTTDSGYVVSVDITNQGKFYRIGDTITILGIQIGGSTPDDNVIITITGVSPNSLFYERYTKQIFERKGGDKRVSYYDESDILNIESIYSTSGYIDIYSQSLTFPINNASVNFWCDGGYISNVLITNQTVNNMSELVSLFNSQLNTSTFFDNNDGTLGWYVNPNVKRINCPTGTLTINVFND